MKLFEKARAVSDYHICGLYGDELCIKWNGSLVMKYNEREAIISKIDFVDKIMELNNLLRGFFVPEGRNKIILSFSAYLKVI